MFWLHQEYEREKRSLLTVSHLAIATEIISDQHEDLEGLLEEIERLSSSDDVEVVAGNGARFERKVRHFNEDVLIQATDSLAFDTLTRVIMKTVDSRSPDSAFVQVHAGSKWKSEDGDDAQQALFNIWPQALFAILLFGLVVFAMRMMQRSYLKQQALSLEKNNLISNMTHELKTPVTTIGVALEAIQDMNLRDDPKKSDQYLTAARKELARLSDSVDMMMHLSRIDQGALELQKENMELSSFAEEVISLMRPQLEKAEVNCTLEFDGPITANIDPFHFKNVLINLIDNAVKYTGSGHTVTVGIESRDFGPRISVSDDGPGIPTQYHSQLFERFFRVPDGDRHNVKGDGLGLSYVKEIVEAHGGQIAMNSSPDQGTTFQLDLPRT